ncbi:Nuclear pore membrane glycoprotein [Thalictrum thalictroides]|uniref:Nuclear pore membrane glycoprotein n=1 Tax=Thalictrum thalictroides TaxID=46969 RepID=A0A7J6X6N0_THATH|nr:Nuclear pore membrane glycoprotein [Thalictrum thalictroides]
MTHPVEYRLQGSDGCFSWSWDHHDILSVQPEYNTSSRCSTSARLKSIASFGGRKETAIYATDSRTGIVIRCKVFIDEIVRIQIFHSSVKLDLDGLATLRVRAFDRQENVFSSLVGLQFKWGLMPKEDGEIHRLVHVPLKESPLSDCGGFCGDLDIQIKLEDSGVFSDLFAVKGTEIGREIVSVNLIEPEYELMADEIALTVAEAMSIEPPSPLFVTVGAYVHYSLKVIRQSTPEVIPLPSPHHWWSVVNSSVAQVDSLTGVAHALNLGITTITVEDTRVVDHAQMSSLHVVIPDTLYLYKLPVTAYGDLIDGTSLTLSTVRWYVVVGQQYVVYMKVFSGGIDGHEVYITQSDDVRLQYDESENWVALLVPDTVTANHHWQSPRILKAVSPGLGRLTASLAYRGGRSETIEVLKIVQEVMVCDQVKFDISNMDASSKTIHLPWVVGIYQEVALKATGGCVESSTSYKWYSSDVATVSVSPSGVVQAKKPSQVTIKVVSMYDGLNYDQVDVKVSIPSEMVMLQNFSVETVVGTYLQAAVTLRTSDGSNFYSCDSFSSMVKWNCGSDSFKIFNVMGEARSLIELPDVDGLYSLYDLPCAQINIYASSVGRALLQATLQIERQPYGHPSDGPKVLKASSLIGSYNPLVAQQIGNGNHFGGHSADLPSEGAGIDELYLVPGTNLDIKLFGGPERWDQSVEFVEAVNIFSEVHLRNNGVLVDQESTNNGGVYRVACLTFGNFQLVFSRGNLVGEDHPLPAVEKVELSLICIFPSSITLIANEPVNTLDVIYSASQADRSLERIRASPITVANGCNIRVAVVGIHKSGKVFANCSSLCLKWELSSCKGLAYWESDGLESSRTSWERFLVLQNTSGLCTVRATVIGISDTMINNLYEEASTMLELSENVLTDALRLQLVSSLRIVPEFLLIYFSQHAKVNLTVTGGTCSIEASVNDTRVVEVLQQPPSLECLHLTLAPKGLGTSLITVSDIGVAPPLAASAVVQVADVDWIKIISEDEISLKDGSEKALDISAGIRDGSVFDSSQYAYMDIHIHIEDPILQLVDTHVSSPGVKEIDAPNFVIRAIGLGITSLYVSARKRSGHEILSQHIKVEVYAQPMIHPDDIFLVPGASYALTIQGGPTVGVLLEYASMDEKTAKVHKSSGLLSAISPGATVVRAIFYGSKGSMICEAEGRVRVEIPSSIILNVQSEQLSVGREMPVFPSLTEGNLFSFYELCKNFKWIIEDEKILEFKSNKNSHSDGAPTSSAKETELHSHSDEKDTHYINVVYGRSAGRANVAVSFSCNFLSSGASHSRLYNASASLWVVPEPPLALGLPITWVLPPFYTTSNLLPGSSELYSQWDSFNQKGTVVYSLLRTCGGKNGEIQQDAISINGGKIRTLESDYLGCIQALDRTSGRIEIASCVRVAEVAQIRVITRESSLHIVDLAVGAEHELVIKYYDALGNPFHEAYNAVQFNVETNYPNVLSINKAHGGNGNIHLKALRHGTALIRVSMNKDPHKSDYMMISVGAHLYPHNAVIDLGSHVNFSVDGLDEPVHGRWLSANDSVLSVDVVSGKAHAIQEGATQVIFQSSSLRLQTTVTVQKVKGVLVESPAGTLTNVPFPTNGYYFSVKFRDSSNKFEVIANNKGVPFVCTVDPPFVGYVKPWRDLGTGIWYCLFFPYSPEHLERSMLKNLEETRPDISISISASLIEAGHVSGSSTALFVGGFSILSKGKELLQLNLTPDSNERIISVIGNTDVEVHWKDREQMLVTFIRKRDNGIGGHAVYEVKALKAKRFNDKIVFILPATGQRVELDVHYEPGISGLSSDVIGLIWIAFCSLMSLFFAIWFVSKAPPNTSTASVPATPIITGPVTPDRSSSSGHNVQQSPRTPQPFIEYVRKTIDETPYYKRDARRRINPQHTY